MLQGKGKMQWIAPKEAVQNTHLQIIILKPINRKRWQRGTEDCHLGVDLTPTPAADLWGRKEAIQSHFPPMGSVCVGWSYC